MVCRPSRLLKILDDLFLVDVGLAEQAQAGGCQYCGGRLHAAHYFRKPRGLPPGAPSALLKRHSFCCAREGCRRRTTPPSARFLGRRVWIAPWVTWVGMWLAVATAAASSLRRRAGFSRRTWNRWLRFWREDFPATFGGLQLQARVLGPPDPRRIWAALQGRTGADRSRWVALLALLASFSSG